MAALEAEGREPLARFSLDVAISSLQVTQRRLTSAVKAARAG